MKVKQLLEKKGTEIWSVAPDDSVFEALALMAEKNVGALMVLDGNDLAGIFSERDYARKIILKGKASKNTRVAEIMSRRLTTVQIDQSIPDCMELMTEHRIRHLPVLEGGRLVGVISIGDVVKTIISEQEFMIEQLKGYITGTGQ
ncbi:MAG TPA: CBS domain-containing protein [Acidobacteriota bacterium]|nr:CBS domain-containing protein [Acidobacteriota bacterium]